MRYLELNAEGVVTNIVVWDGVAPYTPQDVSELLPCEDNPGVSFGWKKVNGMWIPPQPYPSWTLDENYVWQPPVLMPDDGIIYVWDEPNLVWQALPVQELGGE